MSLGAKGHMGVLGVLGDVGFLGIIGDVGVTLMSFFR